MGNGCKPIVRHDVNNTIVRFVVRLTEFTVLNADRNPSFIVYSHVVWTVAEMRVYNATKWSVISNAKVHATEIKTFLAIFLRMK